MSDDKTIANAVHVAERAKSQEDREASQAGEKIGNAIGGVFGGSLGSFGGKIGGALSGGAKKAVTDNVKDVVLDDGVTAKIAIGESNNSPVGVVVTKDQVSVAIGPQYSETIVTVAKGHLTVGNPQKRTSIPLEDPALAQAIEGIARGSLKNVDQGTFNELAARASEAASNAPAATPAAAQPAKGQKR